MKAIFYIEFEDEKFGNTKEYDFLREALDRNNAVKTYDSKIIVNRWNGDRS